MARSARKLSKLNTYTVVLRGRTDIFSTPSKKQLFLESLLKYSAQGKIYAYAITKKDAYIVVKVADGALSKYIKSITVSFARKYNIKFGLGKVFYDRYLSEPLENKNQILEVIKKVNLIVFGGGDRVNPDYMSSYTDYFSDAIVDSSFVIKNMPCDTKKEFVSNSESDNVLKLKKFEDTEVIDYIYNKYGIQASEIHNLSKDKVTTLVSDVMRYTRASARQIARITMLPLRFVWGLNKVKSKSEAQQ